MRLTVPTARNQYVQSWLGSDPLHPQPLVSLGSPLASHVVCEDVVAIIIPNRIILLDIRRKAGRDRLEGKRRGRGKH